MRWYLAGSAPFGVYCLVYGEGAMWVAQQTGGGWTDYHGEFVEVEVTHWMPLPPCPAPDESEAVTQING